MTEKTRKMMLAHLNREPDDKMADDDLCDAYVKWAEKAGKKAKAVESLSARYNPKADPDQAVENIDAAMSGMTKIQDEYLSRAEKAERERDAARADTSTAQATLAASATPKPLDSIQQMALQDSVDALREKAVNKGHHPSLIDGIASCFKQGDGYAVIAASASAHGKPLLRDVLAVLANSVPGVEHGQKAVVTASAGMPETNPAAEVDPAKMAPEQKAARRAELLKRSKQIA